MHKRGQSIIMCLPDGKLHWGIDEPLSDEDAEYITVRHKLRELDEGIRSGNLLFPEPVSTYKNLREKLEQETKGLKKRRKS